MGEKTIIAGSRSITEYETVVSAIADADFDIDCVVCGTADGVDTLGEQWAKENNIPINYHSPDDPQYVEKAEELDIPKPIARNMGMADVGTALIAVWNGESRGTQHMISVAERNDLQIHVKRTDVRSLSDF